MNVKCAGSVSFLIVHHPPTKGTKIHSFAMDNCLKEYVDEEGKVNYSDWKKDTKLLDDYISSLEENPLQSIGLKMILWLIS